MVRIILNVDVMKDEAAFDCKIAYIVQMKNRNW